MTEQDSRRAIEAVFRIESARLIASLMRCHHGARSAKAVQFLRQMGFDRAINLGGGIDAWSEEVDGSVPRY